MEQLFLSDREMLFKHTKYGTVERTKNMFFLMWPTIWEFIGYSNPHPESEEKL